MDAKTRLMKIQRQTGTGLYPHGETHKTAIPASLYTEWLIFEKVLAYICPPKNSTFSPSIIPAMYEHFYR
ncbi:MAG TPA: hypothetical protein DEQ68_06710 [Ruminococcaceae bacterium]|nr:hypothetical protein [Oscillospiraceae bacterium]